jgi:hypothetical protein
MTILAFMLFAITFHTDFEAGSLGKVERVSNTHFRCAVKGEADHDGRNRQASWYYFRIDGGAGRELTIDLTDLAGEYNYRPGAHAVTKDTRPVYSYDGKAWRHFETAEWDEKAVELRLRFKPEKSPVWIAHVPPYTNRDLEDLLRSVAGSPWLKSESIGRSAGGRDILLLTVTGPKTPDANKKTIWLMARQHAWESGTSLVAEGALRFLLSDDPTAAGIRSSAIFKILPMADPDGVARGGVRYNANGYDLNRNWDVVDPKTMPEITAERKAILDWVDSGRHIDLFLALHNTESEDYVEGPIEAGGAQVRALAARFQKLLDETGFFHSPKGPRNAGATTTPGMKGRMTVNQGLFHDRRIPAFLMEQMVQWNPRLGRLPTVQDRLDFGAALARVLTAASTIM